MEFIPFRWPDGYGLKLSVLLGLVADVAAALHAIVGPVAFDAMLFEQLGYMRSGIIGSFMYMALFA
jgi:hypothetical protein